MHTMPVVSMAVSCSTVELAFVATLLGAETLVGLPDPFHGWSEDQTEAVWEQARESLAERRLLTLHPDGRIEVDDRLISLVGTCGFAEVTYVLTRTGANGQVSGHHFHVIRSAAVELAIQDQGALTCQLTALDSCHLPDRVTSLLRLENQAAVQVPNGTLAEPDLRQARFLAQGSGTEVARAFLREAGLHADTAAALTEALAQPLGNGSLVTMVPGRAQWGVDRLSVLESQHGLWLLRTVARQGKLLVDIVPAEADMARDFIRAVMLRALPGSMT